MKVNDIINESDKSIVDLALKHPFLKKYGPILYHGSRHIKEGENKFEFRKRPTHTLWQIHNEINERTISIFGLPVRSLLFTSTNSSTVMKYQYDSNGNAGNTFIILPNGNRCRYFQSKDVNDLTVDKNVRFGELYDEQKKIVTSLLKKKDISDEQYMYSYRLFNDSVSALSKDDSISLYDLFSRPIHDSLEEYYDTKYIDNIIDDVYSEKFENVIEQYVNSIKEIDIETLSKTADRKNHNNKQEIMVYCPDGFLAVQWSDLLREIYPEQFEDY